MDREYGTYGRGDFDEAGEVYDRFSAVRFERAPDADGDYLSLGDYFGLLRDLNEDRVREAMRRAVERRTT